MSRSAKNNSTILNIAHIILNVKSFKSFLIGKNINQFLHIHISVDGKSPILQNLYSQVKD